METVKCLYCGKAIPTDAEVCPHCQAPSHFQQRGWKMGSKNRFLVFFITVCVFCAVMILWLPR